MTSRSVPIRRSLLANLGVMILGLCLAIVGVTVYTSRQIVSNTARRMIDRSLDRSTADLRAFFAPVDRALHVARDWARNGVLDPADDAGLEALFVPILEAHPQISSISLGDAEGRGWMLLRQETTWRTRRVDPPRLGDRQRLREWPREGGEARAWEVDPATAEERYDPRQRDWYRTATASPEAEVAWTAPYTFFTLREPGVTASIRAAGPDGAPLVVAADVLLRDLSDFTQRVAVTPHGYLGVLTEDRRLIGLPDLPAFAGDAERREALLKRPAELGIPIFDDAIAARRARGIVGLPEEGRESVHPFQSGGRRYWADARIVELPPERRFLTVVMVPEQDLVGPLRGLRTGVVVATLAALAAAVVSAFLLARSFGRPLAELARNSARIRRLDLQSRPPVESRIREVSELATAQEGMRTALDAFSRYVPTDVVRELVELGDAARIGGERRTLTVLFTDIQGFTAIAEDKSPEELTRHLAVYFEEMLAIIDETGTVDKLVGDGIMAFWGAPYPDPHHARHAVEASLACLSRLDALNRRWQTEGEPPLFTRFGLATGPALVGNVGSPRRLSYTAVGDVVNLASRLEGLNRTYGTSVLAADPTPELAGEGLLWREIDRVRVSGRSQAVAIHELLGEAGAVDPARQAFAACYARALDLHRRGDWAGAVAELDRVAEPWRDDASVVRLRTAAAALAASPPPDGWEAVTLLDRK
ncbi:MAG TPA: adenylate/guanylate cyclase domain-containing protein [Myxococcota bacterium]|nr:adenylate/guanylate cyclase domain-containing protein [Myxococcota bacterium]